MSGQLVDETVDNVSPAGLHLVAFCYYFRVLFSSILVETFMLYVSQDDAFKKCTHFVFGEIVGEFTHLVEQVDILIENVAELGLQNGINQEVNMWFFEDVRYLLE